MPGRSPVGVHRLQLIGSFALRARDDRVLRISSAKCRAMLAYLALAPGGVRSRLTLAECLWPSDRFEDNKANLRRELSSLRRMLKSGGAEDLLICDNSSVMIALDRVEVDVLELEIGGIPRGGANDEFLEGIDTRDSEPFEEWLRNWRQRIDELIDEARIREAAPREEPRTVSIPARMETEGGSPDAACEAAPKPSVAITPFEVMSHTRNDEEAFAKAQRLTILAYQWLVLNLYVRPLCDPDVVAQVLANPVAEHYARFSRGAQVMPLEFSVAAFRFGHSMIRPGYVFNANFPRSSLAQLFEFTGKGGLGGASRLPDVWVIDWNNFLPDNNAALIARGVDSEIAPGLDRLPVNDPSLPPNVREALENLPVRNLRRSYVLAIPTAQQVLRAMGGQANMEPLTQAELAGFAGGIIKTEGYLDQTPLWLYILLEAELRTGRLRLGKLGSFIVAETLIGLLAEDPESVLHAGSAGGGSEWSPADEPVFTDPMNGLADMLRFAGVL